MAGECPVSEHCLNCGPRCEICIGDYAREDWDALEMALHYQHKWGAPEHPYAEWKKQQRQKAKQDEKDRKKTPAFKQKSRMVKRALKTEEKTRRAVVSATKRSGALNGDGDSRIENTTIGIEDKFQSKSRKQFVVVTDEVDKAHRQSCVLVITTAEGRKFLVSELTFILCHAEELSRVVNNGNSDINV